MRLRKKPAPTVKKPTSRARRLASVQTKPTRRVRRNSSAERLEPTQPVRNPKSRAVRRSGSTARIRLSLQHPAAKAKKTVTRLRRTSTVALQEEPATKRATRAAANRHVKAAAAPRRSITRVRFSTLEQTLAAHRPAAAAVQVPPPKAAELPAQPEPASAGGAAPAPSAAPAAVSSARLNLAIPAILLEGDRPEPSPLSGPGQKHVLAPRSLPPVNVVSTPTLPVTYGTGTLRLLARDPHWLFAHWDLGSDQHDGLRSGLPGSRLTLRVRRSGLGGAVVQEVQVHRGAQDWFVHVPDADACYAVELGYFGPDCGWVSIAGSEPVRTPPDSVTAEEAVRFARVSIDPPLPRPRDPARESPGSSRFEPAPVFPPTPQSAEGEPSMSRSQELAEGVEPGSVESPESLELPESIGRPGDFVSAAAGEWTAAKERELAELIGLAWVVEGAPGSVDVIGLLRQQLEVHLAGAPWPTPGAPTAISPLPASVEWVSSGPAPGAPEAPPEFWLKVNAELVIYGSTEPNARVTIGGRPIRLRPDGSFSFRFALPDGRYALPVSAISVSGDSRLAELEFSRQSHYLGQVGQHPQDPGLRPPTPAHVS